MKGYIGLIIIIITLHKVCMIMNTMSSQGTEICRIKQQDQSFSTENNTRSSNIKSVHGSISISQT